MFKPGETPLRLNDYFIPHLSYEPNFGFKDEKGMDLTADGISIEVDIDEPSKRLDEWQVTLKVFHQISKKYNSPYSFQVEVVGFFSVDSKYPKERVPWLIRTTASSILYCTAREALRNAMSSGPWRPVILPTVTFYTDEAKKELTALIEKAKNVGVRGRTKKS